MRFCILMPSTFMVDEDSLLFRKGLLYDVSKRIKNYIDGLNSLNNYLKELNWFPDIYLLDNSSSLKNLPNDLRQVINSIPNLKYIDNSKIHFYGKMNKSAGIIEQYKTIVDILKNYDRVIHFEPRQELINNNFLKTVKENSDKNYFKMFKRKKNQFNTGLFSINAKLLINYINKSCQKEFAEKNISIEHNLFDYFTDNKYSYELIDLGIIWKRSNERDMIF